MAVPVLNSNGTQPFQVSPVTLASLVTVVSGAPILEWRWEITATPLNLQDAHGINGDFLERVASVADPQFFTFLSGAYGFKVQARNADGWCLPVAVDLYVYKGDVVNLRYWQP